MKSNSMEKKSFINRLTGLIRLQMTALIILATAFLWISYRNVRSELDTASYNLLLTCGRQLENRVLGMEKIFSRFLYGNTDLDMIRSEDDRTRHYASIRLQNSMADTLTIDTEAEFLVVAESEYDLILDSGSGVLPLEDREALRDYTRQLSEKDNLATMWETVCLNGKMYLYKASVQNHRAVAIFLSAEVLLDTVSDSGTEDKQILLADNADVVCGTAGGDLVKIQPGDSVQERPGSGKTGNRCDLLDGNFRLYLYEKNIFIYKWIRNGMIVLGVLILLLYLFTEWMRKDIWKELICPMKELTAGMESIQQGNYDLRMAETAGNLEFSMLVRTFNGLMDEIINLKIRNYEKRLELQEADQKYIRLQLRPHFFLNAMTTVASMSESGKNEEIQQYIQALSRNIRYMFSSGMHTVPLKDEISHVKNYLAMQELKYPGCVFHYMELPEELEEWRIPQMLLHTLVENEYKYAVVRDEVLMLLVKATLTEREGEKMLLLEIEDNGQGYPQEVLEYLNGKEEKPSGDGTRVGLWSVKRLLELMYDRKGLFQAGNIQPHGALNRIYIPRETIHEVRREGGSESVD